jgi:hypothetical protein
MGQEIDKNKNSLKPSVENRADGTKRMSSRWNKNQKKQPTTNDASTRQSMADSLQTLSGDASEPTGFEPIDIDDVLADYDVEDTGWDENEGAHIEEPTVEEVVSFLEKEGQLRTPKNYRGPVFDPKTMDRRPLDWDNL